MTETGYTKANNHFFRVAEHGIIISFSEPQHEDMSLIPSFEPFRVKSLDDVPLFELKVDDTLRPVEKKRRERIRAFDTGNGDTIVDSLDDGGYQFIIKNIEGAECCLLITDKKFGNCRCALNGTRDMRQFGLNNALMLAFAFAGSFRETVLIHASLVRQNGKGYAFTAKSGTGKSTHVGLWLRYLPGCDMMNDDNPIIRIIEGTPYIYGGPWSGKTPCYRNVKAPLGAITKIVRAKENSIERCKPIDAFATLLPACSGMKWDSDIFDNICNIITSIVETTGVYNLYCLPDKEAALLCNKTIAQ